MRFFLFSSFSCAFLLLFLQLSSFLLAHSALVGKHSACETYDQPYREDALARTLFLVEGKSAGGLVADGLTKLDWTLVKVITKFMEHTWISLTRAEG